MAINAGTVLAYLDLDTSKFGNALQTAQSQLTNFADKGGGVSGMLSGIGSAATTVGRALTMGISVPLAGLGVAAVKMGMDFDQQMSRVKAISGATEAEFETLRTAAIKMGADSVFGATDAAKALEYMGMAGWKTEQMIAGLPGIINLAAASGEDLGMVSDIVTDALTAFGLSAGDAAHFADVLAAASTNSNTNVGLMGYTFKYAAPLAGALGYSVEDCAVAIGLMANAGIKGEQAGTSLRAMLTNMAKPTDTVEAAMKKLNISITDSKGQMKPFAVLVDDLRKAFSGLSEEQKVEMAASIAGKEAMSGLLAIVNASPEDYEKLTDAVNNCAGATEKMAKQMLDNLAGDVEELSGGLEGLSLAFSDYVTPAIRTVIQWLTKGVDWFNNLNESVKNTVFRVGLIAAAIGPVLLVGGKLLTLSSGFLGPLALIGGALALVYKHSESLQAAGAAVTGFFSKIGTAFKVYQLYLNSGASQTQAFLNAVARAFGREASLKVGHLVIAVKKGIAQIKTHLKTGVNAVGSFVGALIDGKPAAEALEKSLTMIFGQETAQKVTAVASAVAGGFRIAFDYIKTGVISAANAIQTGFVAVKNKVVTMAGEISAAWSEDGVMGVLRLVGQYLQHGLQAAAGAVLDGARFVREKIADGLTMAKEWLLPKVQTWLGNLGDAFVSAKTWVTNKLPVVKTAIADGLAMAQEWLLPKARTWLSNLGDAFVAAKTWVTGKLATVKDAIADGLSMAQEWLLPKVQTWLGNLGDAFVAAKTHVTDKLPDLKNAILEGLIAAKETITTKAQDMLAWLGNALQSEESKAFLGDLSAVGGWILEKVSWAQETLTTKAGELVNALGAALGSDTVKATVANITGVVATIAEKITSGAGAWQMTATRLIADLVAQLTDSGFLSTAVTGLGNIVTAIATGLGSAASNITSCAGTIISALLEKFSETGFIEGLFTTAGTVVTNIATVIGGVASNITSAASSIGTALVNAIVGLGWSEMFTTAGNVANTILDTIGGVVMDGIGAAKEIGMALIAGFASIEWSTLFTTAGSVAGKVLDVIGSSVTSALDAATALGTALITGLSEVDWASLVDTFGTVAGKLLDNLATVIPKATTSLTSIISAIVNGIAATDWTSIGTSLGSVATKLLDGIMNNLPTAIEGVGLLVEKIGEGMAAAGDALGKAAGALVSGLVTWLLTPENWLKLLNVGVSLVNGIVEGIQTLSRAALEGTANFIVGIFSGIVKGIGGALGFEEWSEEVKTAFDNTYEVLSSEGERLQVKGRDLMATLTLPIKDTADLHNALTAWGVALSEGIQGEFAEASWLANETVVGLFALMCDTTAVEADRAKAMAVLSMSGYGDLVANAIFEDKNVVFNAAGELVRGANEEVQAAVSALGASLPGSIQAGLESGIPILETAAAKVAEVASGTQDKVTTLADAKAVGEEAVESVAEGEDEKKGEVESATQNVSDAVTSTLEPLPGLMEEISRNGVSGMATGITDTQSEVTTATQTVANAAVTEALNTMSVQTGHKIGMDFVRGISNGAQSFAGSLVSMVRGIGSQAVQAVASVMSSGTGYSIGQAMIQAVASGANSMGGYLNSAMRSLANSAVSAFKSAIQMRSPPRVFTDIGEMIPLAVGIGTDSNQGAATKAMQRLADSLVNAWDTPDLGLGWSPTGPHSGERTDGQGFVFNFYGDMHIREEEDIDRISQGIYERFSDNSRGGGVR